MKFIKILTTLIFLSLISYLSWAQTPPQARRLEEEKRKSLIGSQEAKSSAKQRLHLDYGGWLNYRYLDYDNDDNDSSARDSFDYTYFADLRLWLKATLNSPPESEEKKQHTFYLRIKNLFIDDRPKDLAGGYDWDGPHVDYAYFTIDMKPVWIEAGRQYISVGSGLAYSDVNDGIQLWYLHRNWIFKIISAHTLPHQDNVDTSVPGYTKQSDRYFYAAQATYGINKDNDLYGFLLVQRDYSNEEPVDAQNNYTYNSQYFGLGAKGSLAKNIDYWIEGIHQTGKSYIFTSQEKQSISAWAANAGIAIKSEMYSKPKIELEYSFGSGDPDRKSVTDTEGGNTSGKDKNFLYFGYIPTGYALSPRLSNIHICRLGLSLIPFEKYNFFKKLTIGLNLYNFRKDRSTAAIFDPEANADSNDIGNEINLELSWEVFSDLNFTAQYGRFYPGGAYSSNANTSDQYLSLSMTLTF